MWSDYLFLSVLSFYTFIFLNWIYLRDKRPWQLSSFALSVTKSLVGPREIPALSLFSVGWKFHSLSTVIRIGSHCANKIPQCISKQLQPGFSWITCESTADQTNSVCDMRRSNFTFTNMVWVSQSLWEDFIVFQISYFYLLLHHKLDIAHSLAGSLSPDFGDLPKLIHISRTQVSQLDSLTLCTRVCRK